LTSLKDNKLYIGYTNNLEARLVEHNNGETNSLKGRRPLKLIFYEALPTKEEAMVREKFYKSGRGREVIKIILFKTLKTLV